MMAQEFNAPPGWPPPPPGWVPPPGWRPDPSWPPVPDGWPLWVADATEQAGHGVPVGREYEPPAAENAIEEALATFRVEPPRRPLSRQVEVVGEQDYQPAILQALGESTEEQHVRVKRKGVRLIEGLECTLVPVQAAQAGAHRVAVLIAGKQVGFLGAAASRAYSDKLLRLATSAGSLASAEATVSEESLRNGGRRARVTLLLPSPAVFDVPGPERGILTGSGAPEAARQSTAPPLGAPSFATPVSAPQLPPQTQGARPTSVSVAFKRMFTFQKTPTLWVGIATLLVLFLLGLPAGVGATLWFLSLVPFCTGLLALLRRRTTVWFGQTTSRGVYALIISGILLGTVGLANAASSLPEATSTQAGPSSLPAADSTSPNTPTPTATPPGPAVVLVQTLEVKGRAPKTGYDRSLFGQTWADTDRNGCDTRNDILRRDLTTLSIKAGTNGCVATAGTLNDPYSGIQITFNSSDGLVEIDHVVSLMDAWQKGAQEWDTAKRTRFANDPLNLLAVSGSVNSKKGDGDAATWLPPNQAYRCEYVTRQAQVKRLYSLAVTAAEQQAMLDILANCPAQTLPTRADPPTPAPDPLPTPTPTPTSTPVPFMPPSTSPEPPATTTEPATTTRAAKSYSNCTALRVDYPHGVARTGGVDLVSGKRRNPQPAYKVSNALYDANSNLDRDDDGVACEQV